MKNTRHDDIIDSLAYGIMGANPSGLIHPWVGNLREYARMLNNEIEIPHVIYSILTTQDRYIKNCNIYDKAFNAKKRYEEERER
jgi:hypothetical protein